MGKWKSKMKAIIKQSQKDAGLFDSLESRYEGVVDACNALTSAYSKAASDFAGLKDDLQSASKKSVDAVAELSVYEDDMDQAKKDKDKDREKELKKTMSPLEKEYETGGKEGNAVVKKLAKKRDRNGRNAPREAE